MSSPREAERRLCRSEDELTGRQCSVRYSGAAPTIQCRTRRAILNRMRSPIGSQWSSLRMAAETLPNLGILLLLLQILYMHSKISQGMVLAMRVYNVHILKTMLVEHIINHIIISSSLSQQ